MKKATTCSAFVIILNTIHEKGITTKAGLMAVQNLYIEFWFALSEFCHFALLSKSNREKIDKLEKLGVTTREDLKSECIVKISNKLDLVLRQPIEKQYNYCYTTVNNSVIDCFRSNKSDFEVVSLDDVINSNGIVAKDSLTFGDITADDTYNPERLLVEKETIHELQQILKLKLEKERTEKKAKLEREKAQKKKVILQEIVALAKYPAECMVRLGCTHLGMKPRELAGLVIDKGCELAYAEIIFEIAKQNDIELSEIRSILTGHQLKVESVKADTHSAKQVAGQISRLMWRADKRLDK